MSDINALNAGVPIRVVQILAPAHVQTPLCRRRCRYGAVVGEFFLDGLLQV